MKAVKQFALIYGGMLALGFVFIQAFVRLTAQGKAAQGSINAPVIAVILAVIVAGFVLLSHLMDQEKSRRP